MSQSTPAADATQPPRNWNRDTDAPPRAMGVDGLLTALAAGHPIVTLAEGAPGPGSASSRRSARTAVLCAYLEKNPAAGQALGDRLIDAWAAADGGRAAYLIAVANLRAEVFSHAELHHAIATAPAAASELLQSLEEYLSRMEGRPQPGRSRA
jgi:hypothetical protein